jgi:hypothetical protein
MADQDWPYGYEVVVARDASGRNMVPTRVGLKRVPHGGLVVAADCGNQELTFPIPDAARFAAALRRTIQKHTELPEGER